MTNHHNLLTREEFKEAVFKRDNHLCVNCNEPGVDAHHIIERKQFNNGGYYLNNGALLCSDCHILAETTELSVETILNKAGIKTPVYPPHIPIDQKIDKWGNQILTNGQRMRGDMFDEEQVQKALLKGNVLDLFTDLRKYPRTLHFPWSAEINNDDKVLKSSHFMKGQRIIGTIKMDGENTTLYSDANKMHARSLDSKHNFTRDEVKSFAASIAHDIPDRWRICGENVWAQHSISYENLLHTFYGFSIWDHRNVALAWDEGNDNTLDWFSLIGVHSVTKVYDGIFDENEMKNTAKEVVNAGHEGVVFRLACEIPYNEFQFSVAKYVRANHVQTSDHWMHEEIKRNGFKK